jgi:hypothetical protein
MFEYYGELVCSYGSMVSVCMELWHLCDICMELWHLYDICMHLWHLYGTCMTLWHLYELSFIIVMNSLKIREHTIERN